MMGIPSILVVDDEPNGFSVIEALLFREGYQLTYASSGRDALAQLDEIKPDVILLDVMMPDMDGIEVCRQIRANPQWQHIPIIMVTALSSKEDLALCLEAGADDFLSKPVNKLELRARVRSMLRIKQQYDTLKATLQLREDMANMVVHDLRTPITVILAGSQLLSIQKPPDDPDQQRLHLIQTAAQKLNSMTNDLLVLAKLDAGKLLLNRSQIDLSALASLILADFQEIARTKKLQIESHLPEEGHWILADRNLLHRAIDNLLSNAVKFSPSGSRIVFRVEYPPQATESADVQVRIQVADFGPGVPLELQKQIFAKYEIGNMVSGTAQIGLGLTFCKMVAEAHRGRIFVEENQPKGAIFTIEL
jgi:signal transduction histidine kinase